MSVRAFVLLLASISVTVACGQVDERIVADICRAVDAGKPYKAIKHYKRKAKEITIDQAAPRACYAAALNMIGDHGEAERVCRHTVIEPTSPAIGPLDVQWGIALNGLARYDSAETMLWAAAKAGVADRTTIPLAAALQGQRRWAEAIALLDRVIEMDPSSVRAFRERGACHSHLGDSAAARRDLDKAIELAPRDPVNWNSRGYHRWAAFGDHTRAIQDYDRAIKLNPNYSYVFNNRGWSYYKVGKKEKALKDIELAMRKKPGNALVYRNLGVIALEGGESDKACAHFKHALDEGFTAEFGGEVEELMRAHCGTVPVVTPKAPPASNAPGSPPVKSNAP